MIDIQLIVRDQGAQDVESALPADFHYRLFFGDVQFRIGNADFSARWGWIPVLDFAVCLENALRALATGESDDERIEFTESDEAIRLHRVRGAVEVSATFVDSKVIIPLDQLHAESVRTLSGLLAELGSTHPTLRHNAYFSELCEKYVLDHCGRP